MHRDLTDERRTELTCLKRKMVKGEKRKAREAAAATDATAAPPKRGRLRYLRSCIACPNHTSIDIWRHMNTVHADWTREQRAQALEACEYVTAEGTSYDQTKKACPLEDTITKVFHDYCHLVYDTKVARDHVGNVRRILVGLSEEGKPLEWSDLRKFIKLDHPDSLFSKWQRERDLSDGSIVSYLSSLKIFLTCAEDPVFCPPLENPEWVVAEKYRTLKTYTIREYQFVVNRMSLQYRRDDRQKHRRGWQTKLRTRHL
jgi:hypothetical protein